MYTNPKKKYKLNILRKKKKYNKNKNAPFPEKNIVHRSITTKTTATKKTKCNIAYNVCIHVFLTIRKNRLSTANKYALYNKLSAHPGVSLILTPAS